MWIRASVYTQYTYIQKNALRKLARTPKRSNLYSAEARHTQPPKIYGTVAASMRIIETLELFDREYDPMHDQLLKN